MKNRDRVARTLNDAFGPYATLNVERKTPLSAYLWMAAYGVAVGILFYVVVLVRA